MDTNIANGLENIVSKTSTTNSTTNMKTVGKDEFMKLLLAQLKNQDPLKPMDGTDFAAQLAQFSSLEQLSNLNTELKSQSVNQMTLGYAQSANMIGKEVIADSGNSITVSGPSTVLSYRLMGDAQDTTISVMDKNGKLVKTLTAGGQKAGINNVTWDSAGFEAGDYTYQVVAKSASGGLISADTMTSGLVTAVHFRGNQILATVNGQEIALTNITEIKQADNK
jgi:flagellar basal-body rod modification protein FlgD